MNNKELTPDDIACLISGIDKPSDGQQTDVASAERKELEDLKTRIKSLGEEMRIMQKAIKDDRVLVGFNMAVELCNKHIGSD